MRSQIFIALCGTTSASYLLGSDIPIVATTTLPNGQIVDWIHPSSQGPLAPPPSTPPRGNTFDVAAHPVTGPPNTVPVLRQTTSPPKAAPPSDDIPQRDVPTNYSHKHWYAYTSQRNNNTGTSGALSMFNTYVQSKNDFSLLQTGVARNVPSLPGKGDQTVEVGWQIYPRLIAQPHLFTFFTTNSYTQSGDYLGGYNTMYKGWVQSDHTYYPGMALHPYSVVDGAQNDLAIEVKLQDSNWWVGINGKWIGYYPANLFTKSGMKASDTLETKSDHAGWWGEVAQVESSLTTTDMGSGHFAADGKGKSAYIRNILFTNENGEQNSYNPDRNTVSDPARYTLDPHYSSGEEWGSYFFLGGPGAGGVIGG